MKEQPDQIRKVAFIGTYLPRQCGIATFTSDLLSAVLGAQTDVEVAAVAMSDEANVYDYPAEVCYELVAQDRDDYKRCAQYLNSAGFDMVCVQHEFGIFGGESGDYLLELIQELNVPVTVTLHTVLEHPLESQRRVMDELTSSAARIVVMSARGAKMLETIYGVPSWKVVEIPHGVPEPAIKAGHELRSQLGLTGRQVLLTFGLLSPDKGLQYVIEALPDVVKACPDTTYLIVGATHPHIRANHGEAYRDSLAQLAEDLGVAENVQFVNRFVSLEELTGFLAMADIYITPYLKREQITSGTLAYAVGCGKAVISTPYWYAEELLADGRGLLVSPKDSQAIGRAVIEVLQDDELRTSIQQRARRYGEQMKWSAVGASYLTMFHEALETALPRLSRVELPGFPAPSLSASQGSISLGHVRRLTDDTGMIQHATYSVPNLHEGYCLDDNARALILCAHLDRSPGLASREEVDSLATRYLAFCNYAYNSATGFFRNFMGYDRSWLEERGSEDSHGRAIWALGAAARHLRNPGISGLADRLLRDSLPKSLSFKHPRSWAYALLGVNEALQSAAGDRLFEAVGEQLANRLHKLYQESRTEKWHWFEDFLSYGNARIPEALLIAGEWMEDSAIQSSALEALDWLARVQRGPNDCFEPVGCNWIYRKGERRPEFDQQPVDACASVSAYLRAWRHTHSEKWRQRAEDAFSWFMGKNRLGLPLGNPANGSCYDGLTPFGLNLNQGAESTLSFNLAMVDMHHAGLLDLKRSSLVVHSR